MAAQQFPETPSQGASHLRALTEHPEFGDGPTIERLTIERLLAIAQRLTPEIPALQAWLGAAESRDPLELRRLLGDPVVRLSLLGANFRVKIKKFQQGDETPPIVELVSAMIAEGRTESVFERLAERTDRLADKEWGPALWYQTPRSNEWTKQFERHVGRTFSAPTLTPVSPSAKLVDALDEACRLLMRLVPAETKSLLRHVYLVGTLEHASWMAAADKPVDQSALGYVSHWFPGGYFVFSQVEMINPWIRAAFLLEQAAQNKLSDLIFVKELLAPQSLVRPKGKIEIPWRPGKQGVLALPIAQVFAVAYKQAVVGLFFDAVSSSWRPLEEEFGAPPAESIRLGKRALDQSVYLLEELLFRGGDELKEQGRQFTSWLLSLIGPARGATLPPKTGILLDSFRDETDGTLKILQRLPERFGNRTELIELGTAYLDKEVRLAQATGCGDLSDELPDRIDDWSKVVDGIGHIRSAIQRRLDDLALDAVKGETNDVASLESLLLGVVSEGRKNGVELGEKLRTLEKKLSSSFPGMEMFEGMQAGEGEAPKLDPSTMEENLAQTFMATGQAAMAVPIYQRMLAKNARNPDPYANLGAALHYAGQTDEAIACLERGCQLFPKHAPLLHNLGAVKIALGVLDQGVGLVERALEEQPDFAEALNTLGAARQKQSRHVDAKKTFERALGVRSDYAEAKLNLSLTQLTLGEWDEGWKNYEARWQLTPMKKLDKPAWEGDSLEGKTILLHAERGLGDTLQFIRYAEGLEELGASVVLEAQPALVPLLSRCDAIETVIAEGDDRPDFDVHLPLLSLPRVLHTRSDNVPYAGPYLAPDPQLQLEWGERLRSGDDVLVGIAWQGNVEYLEDRERSIPLDRFAPLMEIDGVRFVSLQKGEGSEQLKTFGRADRVEDLGGEIDESSGSFMDTAAIMTHLDLLITSDSALAHLAGGLGVNVWVALPMPTDWRFGIEGDSCAWYPTMRLFRQPRPGAWEEVFKQIGSELDRQVHDHSLRSLSESS
ncbi:photosystem I assembly protein Ycf3 [Planctomycetes bacterium Pan216]|uniref:Photosystem I assembly protein Ycf3 n=1 Tax=Kolteria novifilia TaxID=2527975 RepID=A0A518B2S9_9BACT|nr:photosystem I assembly protein Ycf3 [Planctomycetes bacterium Pan216]